MSRNRWMCELWYQNDGNKLECSDFLLKIIEKTGFSVFMSMKKMQTASEKARGDLEEQYRLLMLAGDLGNIIMKSPRFSKWVNDVIIF